MGSVPSSIASSRYLLSARSVLSATALLVAGQCLAVAPPIGDINDPPHEYRTRQPNDPFARIKSDLESGRITLNRADEKSYLVSLLKVLGVPVSSQMLVFSTTSLQLNLISPSNPRAVYFNEDTYIGYIPGGRIEIASLDPELGAVFYIFDIPRDGRTLQVERSGRCMNCHAGEDTRHVPGLVVKSVVPGPGGGSLVAYRLGQTGHGIPFEQRFGGWYVTGAPAFTNHWGNLIGRLEGATLTRIPNPPGTRFDFGRYPAPGSDLLPQLLLEHQAGFVNRVIEAAYRTRAALHLGGGRLTADHATELDEQAGIITRYLLFADEARLPDGGVEGNAAYRADFLASRRPDPTGLSLKDFDLRTRLFKHRCSYMIYSPIFSGLPTEMKRRVYRQLAAALSQDRASEYAFLPDAERQAIRNILRATIPDLPAGW
jgi:hypothetical protein